MALDAVGLSMVAKLIPGSAVLCLGYPDITARPETVRTLLNVEPQVFTAFGPAHKVSWPLPETVDTLQRAGALSVDCVDVKVLRGVERIVDLNLRQDWPRHYRLVLNPGTVEHCFDVSTAMFNAWRAVEVGGFILHVAPVSMQNHGFWNICPTAMVDFALANGGSLVAMKGRDRSGADVPLETFKRFRVPHETVMYALMRKDAALPETVPVQRRFE